MGLVVFVFVKGNKESHILNINDLLGLFALRIDILFLIFSLR